MSDTDIPTLFLVVVGALQAFAALAMFRSGVAASRGQVIVWTTHYETGKDWKTVLHWSYRNIGPGAATVLWHQEQVRVIVKGAKAAVPPYLITSDILRIPLAPHYGIGTTEDPNHYGTIPAHTLCEHDQAIFDAGGRIVLYLKVVYATMGQKWVHSTTHISTGDGSFHNMLTKEYHRTERVDGPIRSMWKD